LTSRCLFLECTVLADTVFNETVPVVVPALC